jgi:biopolymer transport protein ExbB
VAIEWLERIAAFIDRGGFPLWLLAGLALVMFTMVLYHYLFIYFGFRVFTRQLLDRWQHQSSALDTKSRLCFREGLLSKARLRFQGPLLLLKSVVALCPLLGLLGTVTGMIEVFEVIALMGTADARSMASGVARATLPTMAGMVLAIMGLFFVSRFESFARRQSRVVSDRMGGVQ